MTLGVRKTLCKLSVILLWPVTVGADDSAPPQITTWPGTFVARVEALALLQTLNAGLLSHDSATLTGMRVKPRPSGRVMRCLLLFDVLSNNRQGCRATATD